MHVQHVHHSSLCVFLCDDGDRCKEKKKKKKKKGRGKWRATKRKRGSLTSNDSSSPCIFDSFCFRSLERHRGKAPHSLYTDDLYAEDPPT